MGLDSVEILLEVEDTFNITIPDEEAASISTVGELHDSILRKMPGISSKTPCGSQRAFYQLRRGLTHCFGTKRRKIRTGTPSEEVIPRENRRELWKTFGSHLQFRIPELVRPVWLVRVLSAVTLVVFALCVTIAISGHFLLAASLLGAAGYFLAVSTRPLAVEFSSNCRTVGGLAQWLLQENYGRLFEDQHSEAEVWDILCTIISEQLGAEKEGLKPETNFAKDLNLD